MRVRSGQQKTGLSIKGEPQFFNGSCEEYGSSCSSLSHTGSVSSDESNDPNSGLCEQQLQGMQAALWELRTELCVHQTAVDREVAVRVTAAIRRERRQMDKVAKCLHRKLREERCSGAAALLEARTAAAREHRELIVLRKRVQKSRLGRSAFGATPTRSITGHTTPRWSAHLARQTSSDVLGARKQWRQSGHSETRGNPEGEKGVKVCSISSTCFFCACLLTGVFTLIVSRLCASLFTCYTRRWLALVCLYAPFSALCDIISLPFVHLEFSACASFAVVCYFSLSCQFFFTCRLWVSIQLHEFFHWWRRH